MKLISILILFVTLLCSTTVTADPGNGKGPQWLGQFNYCVDDGTSIADARAECEDAWIEFFLLGGLDLTLFPPVTVTHCPPDSKPDKGKKPFTPNEFCDLVCEEGQTELNCAIKKFDTTPTGE